MAQFAAMQNIIPVISDRLDGSIVIHEPLRSRHAVEIRGIVFSVEADHSSEPVGRWRLARHVENVFDVDFGLDQQQGLHDLLWRGACRRPNQSDGEYLRHVEQVARYERFLAFASLPLLRAAFEFRPTRFHQHFKRPVWFLLSKTPFFDKKLNILKTLKSKK